MSSGYRLRQILELDRTEDVTDAGELLYEVIGKFTGTDEFGVSFNDLLAGKVPPPPEGARFDVHFEAELKGPKLKGTGKGIDHLNMRPDGRAELHIHPTILTPEGASIAFFADGVGTLGAGGIVQLRENVTLKSNDKAYAWVNQIQVWATGTANLQTGEIRISGYKA